MGHLFKDGAEALTKRELMVGLGKAFGKAAAAEVPTELADYVLGDIAAKVTYAHDMEMFTLEKLHEMGVIAIATVLSAGTAGAGGKGFMSVRGKHGGEIGPDRVEYVLTIGEMAQGKAAQGEADAATQTSKEDAAISSALEGDTGIGVLWQPEGNTPGASAQDIAILKQQNTKEDGTLDEDAIVGLCENEDVGLILLDAVKGDEQARKEYNMLLAGEDAKGMSELTEEEMDEIRKELDLVSDDASIDEETDFTPSKKEMAEVEEAIYGDREDQGRVGGEAKKNVRTRAKEIVASLSTKEWELLGINRAAKALGIGRLSKAKESELLRAARYSDKVLYEQTLSGLKQDKLVQKIKAIREA